MARIVTHVNKKKHAREKKKQRTTAPLVLLLVELVLVELEGGGGGAGGGQAELDGAAHPLGGPLVSIDDRPAHQRVGLQLLDAHGDEGLRLGLLLAVLLFLRLLRVRPHRRQAVVELEADGVPLLVRGRSGAQVLRPPALQDRQASTSGNGKKKRGEMEEETVSAKCNQKGGGREERGEEQRQEAGKKEDTHRGRAAMRKR